MTTTIPLLPIGSWTRVMPALGAFIGGVTLPYTQLIGNTFQGPVVLLAIGAAVGAALGELLLFIITGAIGRSFGNTIKRMAMDGLYAGIIGGLAALGLGLLLGGEQEITIQYLASAISGVGLYLTSTAHGLY